MSGAATILAINLLIAGLFCATFVAIAIYAPRYHSSRWFALAYAVGIAYAVIEFLIPIVEDRRAAVLIGHSTFLATLALLNIGIARRYDVQVPRNAIVAVFGTSLVLVALILDMPRESLLRMIAYQAPYAAMQLIGMMIVLGRPNRRPLDNLLAGFTGASALHYLSKPAIALFVGGTGASADQYLATTYAMISQAMGAVLIVATGLLLLSMLITDVLREVNERSETDPLSGLLNRRGFERRLADAIGRNASSGLPVTLVTADLDHFKLVNDSFGHLVGDKLIAQFALTL